MPETKESIELENSFIEMAERMRWAGKLKNESALARKLGVTPQALSNYKKRGAMPWSLVFKFAELTGLSTDWLIHGTGEMYRHGVTPPVGMPVDLATPSAKVSAGLQLTPDEAVTVGKVLKVMRSVDKGKAATLTHMVDAFSRPFLDINLNAAGVGV